MARIQERLGALKSRGRAALIPYITAGDPDLGMTRVLVRAAEAGGASVLEIGIPFSDPMADGPTLQRAFSRSLQAGTTLPLILDLVSDIRARSDIPIVLFGYFNPFLRYGLDSFAADAAAAGVDGILCVDLPPEEAGEFRLAADAHDLEMIFLLAPTSGTARIRKVAAVARGFIYVVSVTGVTGARTRLPADVPDLVGRVRAATELPVAVGFGISRPEQAQWVASFADGVVVGSAVADLIERHPDRSTLPARVESFVAGLRRAIDGAGAVHPATRSRPARNAGPPRPRGNRSGRAGGQG